MKISITLALLSFSMTAYAVTVNGSKPTQTQKIVVKTVGVQKKTMAPKFSLAVISGSKIDIKYIGVPIIELIAAVEKILSIKKGDFEPTLDFNARKAEALSRKIIGDSRIDDLFAFSVAASALNSYASGVCYGYNADSGEVSLYILPSKLSPNGIGGPDYSYSKRNYENYDSIIIDVARDAKKTYQGSNAYGATVTVEASSSKSYGIAANTIPFININRETYYNDAIPATKIVMENGLAAKELPKLKALIVVKISEPFLVYDFMHSEPTRDSPYEFTSQGKYLRGDVLGIVFYSGLTGDILARFPEHFGLNEQQKDMEH